MSFERMPTPMGPEPVPPGSGGAGTTPAALRLQILATEHWGLLATRSLAWTESFTRAGMFLTTLSGAIVALALIAQATAFGEEFVIFALIILPVVLFLGIATFIRIGRSNEYDALCVIGMNRLRHAYLEIAPDIEPYLVMGTHDDYDDIRLTMGGASKNLVVDILIAAPVVLATINAVLVGVIAAVVAAQTGLGITPVIVVGVVAAFVGFGLQMYAATRSIGATIDAYVPKFPRAPAGSAPPEDEATAD